MEDLRTNIATEGSPYVGAVAMHVSKEIWGFLKASGAVSTQELPDTTTVTSEGNTMHSASKRLCQILTTLAIFREENWAKVDSSTPDFTIGTPLRNNCRTAISRFFCIQLSILPRGRVIFQLYRVILAHVGVEACQVLKGARTLFTMVGFSGTQGCAMNTYDMCL